MSVLLFAALAKLVELAAFARSLESWSLIPDALRLPLALVVPSLELAISGSWFLALDRRWSARAGLVLMAAFSIALGAHLVAARPPDCQCLGRILDFQSSKDGAAVALLRNVVLAALLATSVRSWRLGGRE